MSLGWVVAGTIGQIMLAYHLFLLTVFSAGGITNGRQLNKFHTRLLNVSLHGLPAACVGSAAIVLSLHVMGAGPAAYWWYGVPVGLAAGYLVYAGYLNRRA